MKNVQILMMGGHSAPVTYGYLYNWYAMSDANFAPSGWHTPTLAEWDALITELGGSSVASGHLKEVGLTHWSSPNTGADNSSGFTAIASGHRLSNGTFAGENAFGYTLIDEFFAAGVGYVALLSYDSAASIRGTVNMKDGASVRLIKDNSTDTGSVTDYDGNIYPTVKIGTQVWTARNWKCTKLNEGTTIPTETVAATWAGLTTGAKCAYDNDEGNV